MENFVSHYNTFHTENQKLSKKLIFDTEKKKSLIFNSN